MAFNTAHAAYSDALMQERTAAHLRKRAPSTRRAEQQSYQSTVNADKRARPGSPNSWYTATAASTNQAIKQESYAAVDRAVQNLRNRGLIASADDIMGEAGLIMAGAAAATSNAENTTADTTISRRAAIFTGLAAGATALFAPNAAKADNVGYINTVRGSVRTYASQNAPRIVGAGAGIRGNFEVTPNQLNEPKGPVRA